MMQIYVDNIKCGGCANSIRKQLQALDGIERVEVDVEQGAVAVHTVENVEAERLREQVVLQLQKLGYPESGSVHGLRATGAKAKSFVSCAVGRFSDDEAEADDSARHPK
jgi:copper chaperone